MAIENLLTDYTEVDPQGDLTVTAPKVAFDTVALNATGYLYKDFGALYFDDFIFEFEAEVTASQDASQTVLFAISNTLGTYNDMLTASDGITVSVGNVSPNFLIYLYDANSTQIDSNSQIKGVMSHYYFRLERSGSNVTLYIYSDAARTTLVDTLSIVLADSGAKRYLYAFSSRGFVGTANQTGYVQNLAIIQDLTTYTEVDGSNDLTVTAPKVAFDTMAMVANAYLHKDFGVDYFGNFSIDFEYEITASQTGALAFVGMGSIAGSYQDLVTDGEGLVCGLENNGGSLRIWVECIGESSDSDILGGTTTAKTYARLSRSGATLTFEVFSDVARTTSIGLASCTCSFTGFRYFMPLQSKDSAGVATITGYFQDFNVSAELATPEGNGSFSIHGGMIVR